MMDLCIIGGGASGFFCAAQLKEKCPDAQIVIVEKSKQVLQKVKISGGGRCNLTHQPMPPAEFSEHYPRGQRHMKQGLYTYHAQAVMDWFTANGVSLKIEEDGRVFPVSNDSESIIECLKDNSLGLGVSLKTGLRVSGVTKSDVGFTVIHKEGEISAKYVLMATGGVQNGVMPNFLPLSADDWEATAPSLFTLQFHDFLYADLAGISFPSAILSVHIDTKKIEQKGALLITHWGFSGPAMLKLSAKIALEAKKHDYQLKTWVNCLGISAEEADAQVQNFAFSEAKSLVKNKRPFDAVPKRFWLRILEQAKIPDVCKWAELSKTQRKQMVEFLCHSSFSSNGKSLYKEEFVSAGGVSLSSLNAKTMAYKKQAGLYFAGEMVNVDGFTGGFNFQHAWTSAYLVATDIAKKLC